MRRTTFADCGQNRRRPSQRSAPIEALENRMLLSAPFMVKDLNPGAGDGVFLEGENGARPIVVNGKLFFNADDGTGAALWRSDGTAAGTSELIGFPANAWSTCAGAGNNYYFVREDVGTELWKTNGTVAGTSKVTSLGSDRIDEMADVTGVLFYGSSSSIWSTSGAAPTEVFDLGWTHRAENLTAAGNILYFTSDEGLWKTDGTTTAKFFPSSRRITDLTFAHGLLFFSIDNQLWRTDGTTAGTLKLGSFSSGPHGGAEYGGALYFLTGYELWKSDGSAAGTAKIANTAPEIQLGEGGGPGALVSLNGALFFSAGMDLWRSNGTTAGTSKMTTFAYSISELTVAGGLLYFVAGDAAHGTELWSSDGTAGGTRLAGDIRPGAFSSNPQSLTEFKGDLLFFADDGTHGYELWRLRAPEAQTPYNATAAPWTVPGKIEGENFDKGGEGVAYHDEDPTNVSNYYRESGVDIDTDLAGGWAVAWIRSGEWLSYTVNVTTPGAYDVTFRVANVGTGSTFRLESNGVNKTGSIQVPNTGGWYTYADLVKTNISLQPGRQVLRIVYEPGQPDHWWGNLNWFSIAPAAGNAPAIRMQVRLSKKLVADIQNNQSAAVWFGKLKRGAASPVRTFTITNSGKGAGMKLTRIKLPAGYTLLDPLPKKTLAAGKSVKLRIRQSTDKAKTYGGYVRIYTSVPGDGVFVFPVGGQVIKPGKKAKAQSFAPAADALIAVPPASAAAPAPAAAPGNLVGLFCTAPRRRMGAIEW